MNQTAPESSAGTAASDMVLREIVPSALDGERLDRVVAMVADVSRSAAARFIDAGLVTVDQTECTQRSLRLLKGQQLAVRIVADESPAVIAEASVVAFDVLHLDDDLMVVAKAAGVVVHPGAGNRSGTLANGLVARFPELAEVGDPERPGIVHRLDRGTSGALVVARTADAHDALVEALSLREVTREYIAVAWGHLENDRGTIDAPIGRSSRRRTRMAIVDTGREARTHYEVLGRSGDDDNPVSLVRCRLDTGRTHQIRVHLQAIGHSVVGDDAYGGLRGESPFVHASIAAGGRPALHAHRLRFLHPRTAVAVDVTAPIPPDMTQLIAERFEAAL